MPLSDAQKALLRDHIIASGDLNIYPNSNDGNIEVKNLLNLQAAPDFYVWRSEVSRSEVYNLTSAEATTWNWTTYKNQGATEQNAWTQMFMGDRADFSKPNLRAGIAAIFTGSAQANAQRDHCLAMGKRLAKRGEKVLGTGTGSLAVPATMTFEGSLTADDVEQARNYQG